MVITVFSKFYKKYITLCERNTLYPTYDCAPPDQSALNIKSAATNHFAICKEVIDYVSRSSDKTVNISRLKYVTHGPTGPQGFVGSGCSAPPAVSGVTGPMGPQKGSSVSGYTSCTYRPVGPTGSIGPVTKMDKPKENDLQPAKKLIDRLNYFRKRERAYEE